MNKILFVCDVDNTLIHSYKHKREGDICVELLKEKEQGFTSPVTPELLKKVTALENVEMIPLTTRSIEQYTRIKFGEGAPKAALVANGTLLLEGDSINEEWWMGSLEATLPFKAELNRMYELLAPQDSFIRVRIVDEMYLFVYCAHGADPLETAEQLSVLTTLRVQCAGKKIYLFPPAADKGAAARRMAERLGADYIIAAGDSEIDLPMLKLADLAIIPRNEWMTSQEYRQCAVCPPEVRFSEFVLETVLEITGE